MVLYGNFLSQIVSILYERGLQAEPSIPCPSVTKYFELLPIPGHDIDNEPQV